MSEYPFGRERRPEPARRGRRLLRPLAALLVVAVVFVIGIAVGKALNDDPSPGGTVTYVRTLQPLPQQPAATP